MMNKKGNFLYIGILVILVILALFLTASFSGLLSIFQEPEGGVFVNQDNLREFKEGDILGVAGGMTVNTGTNFPVGSTIWIDGQLCRKDTTTISNLVKVSSSGDVTKYSKEFLGYEDFSRLNLGPSSIVRDCRLSGGYHNLKAVNARIIKTCAGGCGNYIDRGDEDTYWTIEQTIFVIPSQLTTTTISTSTTLITTTTIPDSGGQEDRQPGQQSSLISEILEWFASLFRNVTLV